jgi:hypothetical protein
MAAGKVIDKNTLLEPGDRIQIVYAVSSLKWLRAAQWALIEDKLQDDPRYDIESWEYGENTLTVTIRITKPSSDQNDPQPQRAGIISVAVITGAIATAAASVMVWLSVREIRLLSDTPAGKDFASASKIASVAGAIGAVATVYALAKRG